MAFHAKQFMSLFLLLIISRLILSTHAAGRLFSQYARTATTTSNQIDNNHPDQFTQAEEQPVFVTDQLGQPNGFGTSPPPPPPTPSFRPLNYDPKMYTTSQATQKKDEPAMTVAEQYGPYESFSNSKLDEQQQQQNDENKEEIPSTHNYKDISNQFPQRTQQEPDQYDPTASQKFIESNEFYSKNNEEVPTTTNQLYGNNYNKFSQEQNNGEKYISGTPPTANQFGNKNHNKFGGGNWKNAAPVYKSRYSSNANQEDIIEDEDDPSALEGEGKNKLPNDFYNKNNNKWPNSNSQEKDQKYNDWKAWAAWQEKQEKEDKKQNFAYTDAELNALLDEEAIEDEQKNNQQYNSKWGSKTNGDDQQPYKNEWAQTTTYAAPYKKQNSFSPTGKGATYFGETDEELSKLMEDEDESPVNKNKRSDHKNVNEWPTYHQKQEKEDKQQQQQQQHFAYTDAQLNALLDQEEKVDEDEMDSEPSNNNNNNKLHDQQNNGQYGWNKNDRAQTPYKKQNTFTPSPPSAKNDPQGISDTRFMGLHYDVDKEEFDGNGVDPEKYRNAFSGNAMEVAFANAKKNNP